MKTLKKTLLATAAAAAMGLGMLPAAHADTFASAILRINNFRLLHAPGGTSFRVSDFSSLAGTNDARVTAILNGLKLTDQASIDILSPTPPNLNQQCAGPCPVGPDIYTPIPIPGTNFAHADEMLTGSSIASNGGPAPGANAMTRADAGTVSSPNDANGSSNVGTSTTFRFSVATPGSMTVEFDAIPFLQAFVSPGAAAQSNANSSLNWNINILDLSAGGAALISAAPMALNQSRSATNGAPANVIYNPGMSSYSFTTSTALLTGHDYQLTVSHSTEANALQNEVPEPGTLAVLGAGLMGMTLVIRRRKQK